MNNTIIVTGVIAIVFGLIILATSLYYGESPGRVTFAGVAIIILGAISVSRGLRGRASKTGKRKS